MPQVQSLTSILRDRAIFESEGTRIHAGLYEYTGEGCRRYVNASTPIRAWCTLHKDWFTAYPNQHIDPDRLQRCRLCRFESNSRAPHSVYLLIDREVGYCNFGYSMSSLLAKRIAEHNGTDNANYLLERHYQAAARSEAEDFEGYLIGLCYWVGSVPIEGRCEVFEMPPEFGTAIFDLSLKRWNSGRRDTGKAERRRAKAALGSWHNIRFRR